MPVAQSRGTLTGILAVVLACVVLGGMDALGKHLMAGLSPVQVIWARYLGHALIYAGLLGLGFGGWRVTRPRRPGLQAARSLLLLGVTLGAYFAIRAASLADATALMFFAPVLVTVFAGIFLRERIGPARWAAVGMGFTGVLVIVRPGMRGFEPALLLALAAAVSLAFYFILTRHLRQHDSEQTTVFLTPMAGALCMSLAAPFWWTDPSPAQWLLLLCMGALGGTGHFLLTRAFHLAPASTLSPFLNAQLIAAAIYSAVFFGDTLETAFFLGAGLIMGAGLLVSVLERRGNRPVPP